MSFWFYKKDKKSLFAVDIPLELLIFIVAILAAFFIPAFSKIKTTPQENLPPINLASFFIILGFCLFLAAKISLFAKGIWNSWGISRMSGIFQVFYIMGYLFITLGIMLAFFKML